MKQNVVEANRERELWLVHESWCYFIPQGWCDAWSVSQGFTGGLDYVDDDGLPAPEIYCYAPVSRITEMTDYDTMFVPVSSLQQMEEITEELARELEPGLFQHLDQINQEARRYD